MPAQVSEPAGNILCMFLLCPQLRLLKQQQQAGYDAHRGRRLDQRGSGHNQQQVRHALCLLQRGHGQQRYRPYDTVTWGRR